MERRLARACLVVGVLAAVTAATGTGAGAAYRAQTTADEPQYLLTAMSLAEDLDLDIADEVADARWRDFHEATLPEQTKPLADGRRVSPHDPLLPVVLALPVAAGGWVGAKLALATLAGVLAALLVWVAVRRFGVPVHVAAVVVGAFALSPPLSVYGTQVYPELPAALVVTIAVAALTGPLDRRGLVVVAVALVALPWLSIKYAPVVVALAGLLGWRLWSSRRLGSLAVVGGALALQAVVFGVVHQVVYGGWTAYAAGDHFVGGELTVMGSDPDHLGRSHRLSSLLVDRGFGLAAWAPVFLLAVPALAAVVRRRSPGWSVLALPFAAGWLNGTFVALTMHGWWWPGRQVVVVVPLLVLAVAWWVGRVAPGLLPVVVVTGALGLLSWLWLVAGVLADRHTLIVDFERTTNPWYRAWRLVLPDHRTPDGWTGPLTLVWIVLLATAAFLAWRHAGVGDVGDAPEPQPVPSDAPACLRSAATAAR